ncbi:MAG TPA: YbjN domain-containing protein [Propionibacteriaceae bacterium]|nr:YbjN domain-containing protein [Propionibacteriaceae bacterium]
MADIDDFDIDKSIAAAWAEFQARLSEVVSMIDESGDLTIGTGSNDDQEAPFIRLSSPRPHLVRGEAASNAALGEDYQLGPDQLATMEGLGWHPPSVDGDHPSAHFWVECDQDDAERISALAVGALRDVYGVQHPIFLAPDQLAEVLQPGPAPVETSSGTLVPTTVPAMSATMPRNQPHLNQLVDAELGRMFGYPPIHDTEGDVAIRVGSTMLFLRTSPDAQEVVVFAAVVHDVAGRSRAAEVLNDLNVEARWVKFQLVRDRVFVTVSVLARPFVPAHLHHAVKILAETADGIDNELAVKLGGRTTFDDHDEDP